MGYSTEFIGKIKISPKIVSKDKDFLDKFFQIRHMKRDMSKLVDDKTGEKVKDIEKFGKDGCFYLKDYDWSDITLYGDMKDDKTIIDINNPGEMPSLWCNLEIVEENGESFIQWDGSEKTYGVNEDNGWFTWLIDNFFKPNGYILNGEMTWQGEDDEDVGTISIKDNVVDIQYST